ncbi:MAG: hypothetical protein ACMXYE_02200 [Candidatus Woesearchaeota archaeon]
MAHRNEFISAIRALQEDIEKIKEKKISLDERTSITDYRSAEWQYVLTMYKKHLTLLKKLVENSNLDSVLAKEVKDMDFKNVEGNEKLLTTLEKQTGISVQKERTFEINRIPDEIRSEVRADLEEMQKCFSHECYRSCIILCGRIIEVCLHAKYYKVTGFDILDKNPGIGLGKLIAKMDEKGIKLDPGLTQQIHLVNNVRIFSVHKKQRLFVPSREQTHAIMLYTADVLRKLF